MTTVQFRSDRSAPSDAIDPDLEALMQSRQYLDSSHPRHLEALTLVREFYEARGDAPVSSASHPVMTFNTGES
jgi:hypothetical protein